eukprot:631237_1
MFIYLRDNYEEGRSSTSSSDNKQLNQRFLFIAKKYFVLATCGVGSTFIAMILTIVFSMPVLWVSVDYVINVLCILLMFTWNKRYYNVCCCVQCRVDCSNVVSY